MSEEVIIRVVRESLFVVLLVSAPAVLVSLVIGLLVSLFQAVTQLQDHTLSFVPKLVGVMLALLIGGGWMAAHLVRFTVELWRTLPLVR